MQVTSDATYLHQGCEGRADVLQACCLHVSYPLMQQVGAGLPVCVPLVLVQPSSCSRASLRPRRIRLVFDCLHSAMAGFHLMAELA